MINRKKFFDAIRERPFNGSLDAEQVDGIGRILDEWERRGLTNDYWLAYMLATVFHETARKMQPIQEMGSAAYLRSRPYWPYIGEGLVQVTWRQNYEKFGAERPGDLLEWPLALRALFDGMLKGMFTHHKLADFEFPRKGREARKIINGMDRASLIWGYAVEFHNAIETAQEKGVQNELDYRAWKA